MFEELSNDELLKKKKELEYNILYVYVLIAEHILCFLLLKSLASTLQKRDNCSFGFVCQFSRSCSLLSLVIRDRVPAINQFALWNENQKGSNANTSSNPLILMFFLNFLYQIHIFLPPNHNQHFFHFYCKNVFVSFLILLLFIQNSSQFLCVLLKQKGQLKSKFTLFSLTFLNCKLILLA